MNELVKVEPNVPAFSYHDIERIAGAFAQSRMFGVADPAAALSLCLLAQAEGQHPAIAFRDYSIIQGKPAKKAEAMQRDFLQSGGKIKWMQLDDTCAKAEFSHPAGGTAVIDWTLERAKAAGLGGKDMWKKYPRQMLRSRVISEGVRTVCPMATSGMYVPEEVADFEPVGHDAATDGIIDVVPTNEPAPRTKLDGPHSSKTALKAAVTKIVRSVQTAKTVEAVDKIKSDERQTINQALRDWPELINGDPNVEEDTGLKGVIEARKAALVVPEDSVSFQMLMSVLDEAATPAELQTIINRHGDAIDALDDIERDRFEKRFDEREVSLQAVEKATAGA